MFASFKSIGAYTPENVLTNAQLEKMVDTTDEWIKKRTGIESRYIATDEESTSDLGARASEIAIERAGLKKDEIDLIICATISPDYLCMPSTACVIADKLNIRNTPAFDISAACSGFIYLITLAKSFIESKLYRNILIIGAEKLSSITDWSDRSTCVLFGDGAGAAIISATENQDEAIIDTNISSDGQYQDFLITPGGGSKNPCSQRVLDEKLAFMKMRGNETFKVAVRTLSKDVKDILAKNSIASSEVDFFIPHQANYRIIKAVGDMLDFESEKVVITVNKYGNTSSASIPMAINELYEAKRLKSGNLMLLDAFGGGLTWGSALVKFAGENLK